MKPPGHTFGSDFCSITEITGILLLNFCNLFVSLVVWIVFLLKISHLQVRFLTIF